MKNFECAVTIILGYEGGYDTDPNDPGNWTGGRINSGLLRGTKFGISANAYPNLDIQNITINQAKDIYKREYWDRMHCDDIPGPLAMLLLDAAVNNGASRASRWLQIAAGVTVDGIVGPETITSIYKKNIDVICYEFQAQRMNFMALLPDWPHFGLGWARRLCRLLYQSKMFNGA